LRVLAVSGSGRRVLSIGGAAVFGVDAKGLFELVFEDDDTAGGLDGSPVVDKFPGAGGDAKLVAGVAAVAALGAERGDQAGLAAVACDPLRESAHRRLAVIHMSEGNLAEALRQYHLYRELARSELGLPPSSQFRRLVAPLLGRPADRTA
jgi:hypothetical protein